MTVTQLLAALASPDPTPGGGTAAAIAGAMGTSLLVMVAGLAKSRNNTDDEKAALANARAAIEPITATLTGLADADAAAFDRVMAAYRLPKATRSRKDGAHAGHSVGAARCHRGPAQTLRACASALDHAQTVADHGNRSADSDVGVAIGLLKAAADGAAANVRINLEGLKDEGYKAATEAETARLLARWCRLPAIALTSTDVNVQSRSNTPGTSTTFWL